MTIQLWHSHNTRSMRPLWALTEMSIEHEIVNLPFPPRFLKKEYLELNSLGTVPFLIDGETQMTESSAMLIYLAEKYHKSEFLIDVNHKEYGDFLNWLFQSDTTLTFPQTLLLRYGQFEPKERQIVQVVEDYRIWFHARLKRLNAHLLDREFLCDERFTIADIAVGYALFLGELLGLSKDYQPQIKSYLKRLKNRPAFKVIKDIGKEEAQYNITPLSGSI